MRGTRRTAVTAALLVLAVTGALTGCTTQSLVVDGSTVTVASAQDFTSFNDNTRFGNTPANTAIVAATNAGFGYYDDAQQWVRDESFGRYAVVSQDPLTVRYTVNDGVTWSDGEAIDGADLLLAWASDSGALNTEGFDPGRLVDEEGQFGEFPDDTVYFDGALHSGLENVTQLPELGDDGRSITLVYDEYFADWELSFQLGLPAHVVAGQALDVKPKEGETEAAAAKRALVTAVTKNDATALSRISQTWNSAFNVTPDATPETGLLVGSGPYTVSDVTPNESVTLTANPEYSGDRRPRFETVVVRTITDPLETVNALRDGEVDVIAPTPSADVLDALEGVDGVTVVTGQDGQFEHIDLQAAGSRSGVFADQRVREAFLLTLPRERIVDELVRPLDPDAVVRDSFTLAPGRDGYDDVVADNGSERFADVDIDAAEDLLAEAGVTAPEVCILFDPANPRRVAQYTLIAESAGEAGFVVTDCSRGDWEEFLGVNGTYDAALFAWSETTAAVTSPAARLASGSTVSNFTRYSNDEVDRLLVELTVSDDLPPLLTAIDGQLWQDAYGAPLFQFPSLVAHSDEVDGIRPSPLSPGLLWNVWQWQPASTAAK